MCLLQTIANSLALPAKENYCLIESALKRMQCSQILAESTVDTIHNRRCLLSLACGERLNVFTPRPRHSRGRNETREVVEAAQTTGGVCAYLITRLLIPLACNS